MADSSKKNLKKRLFISACAALLLVVCLVFYSLGWFSGGRETSVSGLQMRSASDFTLLTRHTKKYDENVLSVLDGYIGRAENGFVTENGQTLSEAERDFIIWGLSYNTDFRNDSSSNSGIYPGTHGLLEFWVVDNEQEIELDFELLSEPFIPDDESDEAKASREAAERYLPTHILFFEHMNESAGTYYDRINGSFTRKFAPYDPDKPDENHVVIYWIWPDSIAQIMFNAGDPYLTKKAPVFSDISERAEVISKMKDLSYTADSGGNIVCEGTALNYFCVDTAHEDVTAVQDMIRSLNVLDMHDSTSPLFPPLFYSVLSDAYNEADQRLGTGLDYITLRLNAKPSQ